MFSVILQLKLATTTMAGWMAATSPVPLPMSAFAMVLEARAASPVEVKLHDENHRVDASVLIGRDGTADPETTKQITHLFRCRVTGREAPIARRTLAMLADLGERYSGKRIEFVSAFRVQRGESRTSPHRNARAIDFRIRGVALREIRDYLWRKYTEVGIGWYPSEQFLHMDSRPTMSDTAWTFVNGNNRYHPYWAELARRPGLPTPATSRDRRPGS
jgi:uncharacterized protein YcbK (DUF882 family)